MIDEPMELGSINITYLMYPDGDMGTGVSIDGDIPLVVQLGYCVWLRTRSCAWKRTTMTWRDYWEVAQAFARGFWRGAVTVSTGRRR